MNRKLLITIIAILSSLAVTAQVPGAFKYQAVARDANGELLKNKKVSFQISLLQGSIDHEPVYSEVHEITSNDYGLVHLDIGTGTSGDDFNTIDWSAGSFFVKIEMDASGGSNYKLVGTSQLLSVPYAIYAKYAENVGQYQVLSLSNDTIHLSNGGFVVLPDTIEYARSFDKLTIKSQDSCDMSNEGAMRYNAEKKIVEYCNGNIWIALQVDLSTTIPELSLSGQNLTSNGILLNVNVMSNGGGDLIEKGICWNTTGMPTIDDNKNIYGNGNSNYDVNLSSLSSSKMYYARAYAKNTAGIGYSNEFSFTTLPDLTTLTGTFINYTQFSTGGSVNEEAEVAVTERGIVYGLNPNPTISDNKIISGSGTGDFTVSVDILKDTGYYYRAYAVNSGGVGYGPGKYYGRKTVDYLGSLIYVHPFDNSTGITWSNGSVVSTGANSMSDGLSNTSTIVSVQGAGAYAAYLCDTLSAYGFNDWYLPSKNELDELHKMKNDIGGFSAVSYWNSTEKNNASTWLQNFSNGSQYDNYKYLKLYARCIRKE
ncbi:MAG: DUF1566 domain-containing protein [bacterium]